MKVIDSGKINTIRNWFVNLPAHYRKWKGRTLTRNQNQSRVLPLQSFRWKPFKHLGRGRWGSVQQYTLNDSGHIKVVKKINAKNFSDREVSILKKLSGHDHCISMDQHWRSNGYHYISMEDSGMDIGRLVYQQNRRIGIYHKKHYLATLFGDKEKFVGLTQDKNDERFFKSIFFQALKGLDHMHQEEIVHRDIKPSNIFITSTGQVRLGDFGSAIEVNNATTFEGDLRYQPPESSKFRAGSYTEKSDVWMLGLTMAEILIGKRGTQGFLKFFPKNVKSLYKHLNQAVQTETISKDTADLLKAMLARNPNDRPSAQEILRHDYFQKDMEKLDELHKIWKTPAPSHKV